MEIVLNKEKLTFNVESIERTITLLLYNRSVHFPFQTVEKIKEDMKEVSDFIIECLQELKDRTSDRKNKLKIGRAIRKMKSFVKYSEYKSTKEKMVEYIYDFFLSLECLGTLPGFGFGNKFGDKLMGNSERISLRNIRTLLKE